GILEERVEDAPARLILVPAALLGQPLADVADHIGQQIAPRVPLVQAGLVPHAQPDGDLRGVLRQPDADHLRGVRVAGDGVRTRQFTFHLLSLPLRLTGRVGSGGWFGGDLSMPQSPAPMLPTSCLPIKQQRRRPDPGAGPRGQDDKPSVAWPVCHSTWFSEPLPLNTKNM